VKTETYCTLHYINFSVFMLLEAFLGGNQQSEIETNLKTSKKKYPEPYPTVSCIIQSDELHKHDKTIMSSLDVIRTKSSL